MDKGRGEERKDTHAQPEKAERNRRWEEENRAALDAFAEEVAREGVLLEKYRMF